MNRDRESSNLVFESCTDVSDQGGSSCVQSSRVCDSRRVCDVGLLALMIYGFM